ncbi:multiheme c-type cytochrome [uncultured Desulfuromusa sp.]|uniref:multiheme c-type cytochrome n=1 Tax=uncultured Desulfuromusa sp. TaxID=219183 RepID=UPI002AA82EED|nr:multiheme c-type cytochrome [uncultured Desulfuromusa sp.]
MKRYFMLNSLWLSLLLAVLVFPFSVAAMEMDDCLGCHSDVDEVGDDLFIDGEKFLHTEHADMGCVTCHESVTDEHPDDGEAVSNADCLDCHEEVSDEYMATEHAENASCSDCHNPHQVHGIESVSGPEMNQKCSECHESVDVMDSHAEWLPQASLHISKIPCITCHTAAEGYQIVLNITQKRKKTEGIKGYRFSTYEDLKEYSGDNEILSIIDTDGDNHISLAELRTFNKNPEYSDLHLSGTMVPDEISHVLSTHDNRYDCSFCHASGPGSMQTSFVAFPTENGTYQRMSVEEGAMLDTLYGTPNFYMTGPTRSAAMNIIGLLIICGGFIMPIGHGTLRFLTRKNRKH